MAKLNVYSVFDSKVKAFCPPFTHRTHGEALRGFSDAACDDKSMIGKHPEDFSLMYLGEYDDQSGQMIPLAAPTNLGLAAAQIPAQS